MIKEEYHSWHTDYLNQKFELLVFGHAGHPILLFPTSRSRYYQYKDFSFIENAREQLESGKIKIYCPDGIDDMSWYNYDIPPSERVKKHGEYEKVILKDVLPFIRYETGKNRTAVGGCSFGAYHAANFTFRHPEKVSHLFCMGGAYDITRFIHGHYDDNCYYNNPPDYMPRLSDDWYLSRLRQITMVFGTGSADFCLPENTRLSEILSERSIPHRLDLRGAAGHDWYWWKEMFLEYIQELNN